MVWFFASLTVSQYHMLTLAKFILCFLPAIIVVQQMPQRHGTGLNIELHRSLFIHTNSMHVIGSRLQRKAGPKCNETLNHKMFLSFNHIEKTYKVIAQVDVRLTYNRFPFLTLNYGEMFGI